ncbi:MAG: tRNA pseudouridine(38-40) synthase TruA [Rhodospirillales bacterium]
MPRYRVTLEYDGSGFVGWQRQENGPSVQEAVERAVHRFCGEIVSVSGAGRTDAGVHALGQVAHFDLQRTVPPETVRNALNFHLRSVPVAVLAAEPAPPDFHARFSARGRAYLYRIVNRRARPVLDRGRCWWVPVPLDDEAMADAARRLVGHHDFTSFRASICQAASPMKTLDALVVERDGDDIRLEARARSFLHHQVRNIVGTLRQVGEGRRTPADVTAILEARDRARAGPTAPAQGLYLVSVRY